MIRYVITYCQHIHLYHYHYQWGGSEKVRCEIRT